MVPGSSQEKPKSLSPEEILRSCPNVKEIIFPDEDFLRYDNELIEIQLKNNLSRLKLIPEMKKNLDIGLAGFIKAPAIIDDFEDDRDRNELENNIPELTKKGSELYKSNRLRISNIRHVIQLADLMNYLDILNAEQKEKLKARLEDIWAGVADRSDENKRKDNFEGYDKMTPQEKVAFAEKVAVLARDLCIDIIKSGHKV